MKDWQRSRISDQHILAEALVDLADREFIGEVNGYVFRNHKPMTRTEAMEVVDQKELAIRTIIDQAFKAWKKRQETRHHMGIV